MAAAFGCMTTMSLVMGLRGPEVISFGAMFALWSGGMFKVCEKLSKVKADDVSYDKTRDKFSCIGLGIDHHGMNFNTGFFTSNALSLLPTHRQEGGEERRQEEMVLLMSFEDKISVIW
ncbi:hypothetical protein HanHA300_Chr01g0028741 [Helianthus annuus]|nr:hypothetical protein HanHA300_Chr01g0028741 [Helianthus annuus]KAJ0624042.1 putative mitochondrial import inner membrane translocase subunit TIM22 [Helianthus annuus]KAJ0793385.1 hypothetical protein HanOQP8_Chr01g0028991 [Helianthus annuus]